MYGANTVSYCSRAEAVLKRGFDLIVALGGLILLSPLLVMLAIAVKAHDGGPVFSRATRVGRDGELFRLYAFRTITTGLARQPAASAQGEHPHTPIGCWLRRAKLDKLPQLFNVLVGDMSLVGPRAEDPRYVALYTGLQRRVLRVRPGMIGVAALDYRHEELGLTGPGWESVYRYNVMPVLLALELDYLARRTLWSDIDLILRAIAEVFR